MKGGHGRVALFGLLGVACVAALWMLGQGSEALPPMAAPNAPLSQSAPPGPELVVPSLPALKAEKLANGLMVYIYPLHEVPLLSIRLVVPAGSAHEAPSKAGLAALTARLLASGGADEASPLSRAEALGAKLALRSSLDEAVISLDGLSRDLGPLLGLAAEVVQHPRFTLEDLRRRQSELSLESERAHPAKVARDAARAALFAKTPYRMPPQGTPRSVNALSLPEVREFFEARYVPDGAALFLVGDIDLEEGLRLAKEALSGWSGEAKTPPLTISPPSKGRRVLLIDAPEQEEVLLCVASFSLAASHPDIPALAVINDPLGGGLSRYLLDELRVNRGIAYDARSRVERYRYAGWLFAETVVAKGDARLAIDIILKSLADYRALGPSGQELSRAKALLASQAARLFEEPKALSDALAQAFARGAPLQSVGTYASRLRAVDREHAQRALREHFPGGRDDVVIVVVGPAKTLRPALGGLGALSVIAPGEHYGVMP